MVRIICDTYVKGEKHIWDLGKDNVSNQEFNRKILAVNDMYCWLYQKGVLRNVSFEIRDYSDVTFFALDVKDLEPYRNEMAASGLKDADIALRHIFDEHYTPCEYSGAIELGWTMRGYRDFDGTVSRSWECGLVKGLNAGTVLEVEAVKEREGVRAAVRAAFEFAGFEPSDITKDGRKLCVKPLSEVNRPGVEALDDMSGNYVSQWLEDNTDYAWGLFLDDSLIGYCSIGYADDCGDIIEGFPGYTSASLLLSDVFVVPEHRGQGCALYLANEAIKLRTENEKELVFLTLLHDGLRHLYEKIGFSLIDEDGHVMVRDERSLDVKKFEEAFAYYSNIDKSMIGWRDYLFSHAEKIVECYESGEKALDLIDVDCWAQYEKLLGENLSFDEYCAVNSVLDGDPHDIEERNVEAIAFLREILQDYRDNGDLWEPWTPQSVLSLIEGAVLRSEGARDCGDEFVEKKEIQEEMAHAHGNLPF